jgi:Protein of unknown function (DUF3096).
MSCCTTPNDLVKEHQAVMMTMQTHLSPLVALIVGILILIFPRFLNYLIAIYRKYSIIPSQEIAR